MRSESEVLSALRSLAAGDDRIRVALLNGSRVNPAHSPDLLSDYDVLLSVTDVESFVRDESWIAAFGAVLLMQRPHNPPPRHTWLIVYADGVRIDFTCSPLDQLDADVRADSLTALLFDKDGRCPPLLPATETSYYVPRPGAAEFAATFNEFWWVLVYAAKGLWRNQLPYAKHTFDVIVRGEMMTILSWYASAHHGWAVNPGSYGKYLPRLLPPATWQEYQSTFAGAAAGENWHALFAAATLVQRLGSELSDLLGLHYNAGEGENALRLIRAIHNTQPGAGDLAL